MIIAAGILITAPSGKVLFLKRSGVGDYAGSWSLPGGKVEADESLDAAALRETVEETGTDLAKSPLTFLTRRVSDGVDFTTFAASCAEEFTPVLSDEHVSFAWMTPADALSEPLMHPGVIVSLSRLTMDELGVARAIMNGDLASPQQYKNILLVAMRITGTGVSYRKSLDEFVYRHPDNYLTPDFLARCNGLPVIMMHPKGAVLNSEEFANRVVGTMLLPYIYGNEVWGIAKIYDDAAAELIKDEQLSTSPSVVLTNGESTKMVMDDGSTLLVEGKIDLLDHLAICRNGVWDKGQEPNGIRADSIGEKDMSEEDKARKDAEEKAKADAAIKADAEEKDFRSKMMDAMGKLTAHCDSLGKRIDAMSGGAEDLVADKAKKDAEEEEAKKKADADKEEEEAKKKADSEKIKADSAEAIRRIAAVESKLPKQMSDADFSALADAQARADDVFNGFGLKAPRPLDGETVTGYNRRATAALKTHSPRWKDIDLATIADDKAFGIIQDQVYADAVEASNHPVDLEAGELRAIPTIDRMTGQRVISFKGKNTFIKELSHPGTLATFNQFKNPDAA